MKSVSKQATVMKKFVLLTITFMLASCQFVQTSHSLPDDFIEINTFIPGSVFDIRYFGSNNFVGQKITGYLNPKCILHKQAAIALKRVSMQAQINNMKLKIFDCYRPQQAVDHFVRWSRNLNDLETKAEYYPNLKKSTLIGPYIAAKSGHSRGATIDLTLVQMLHGQWSELDMGSPYDFLDPISNTDDKRISEEQKANRYLLKDLMEAEGFQAYDMEWWHFSLQPQPYPDTYFNFPVK